jgi:hypothetical protein
LLVCERELEPVAEVQQRVLGHLLGLVGDHLALTRHAHPVALDRLGEDHGRLAGVLDGGVVCRVDLLLIEAVDGLQPLARLDRIEVCFVNHSHRPSFQRSSRSRPPIRSTPTILDYSHLYWVNPLSLGPTAHQPTSCYPALPEVRRADHLDAEEIREESLWAITSPPAKRTGE